MSLEVIPEQYRHPFKPLSSIAHDQVAKDAIDVFLTEVGVSKNVSTLFERFNSDCPDLIKRISNIAKYVEPYDDDLELVDPSSGRYSVYMSGTTIGLFFTSIYASGLGIDDFKWQNAWAQSPRKYDFPTIKIAGETISSSECGSIGDALIRLGEDSLNLLDAPYQNAIDIVSAFHPSVALYDHIYRSAFAYSFSIGKNIVTKMAEDVSYDLTVGAVIPDDDLAKTDTSLDNAYRILLESESPDV